MFDFFEERRRIAYGEGGGEKIEKDAETVKREAKLAGNFTDQSYPYCNSTNLYKMPYHEQAEDDGISLIQYDLKGNHRRNRIARRKPASVQTGAGSCTGRMGR